MGCLDTPQLTRTPTSELLGYSPRYRDAFTDNKVCGYENIIFVRGYTLGRCNFITFSTVSYTHLTLPTKRIV